MSQPLRNGVHQRLAARIRDVAEHSAVRNRSVFLATVVSLNPFRLELHDSNTVVQEGLDLLITQGVLAYDKQWGVELGDNALVDKRHTIYIWIQVLADLDPSPPMPTISADLEMNNHKVIDLHDPTAAQDGATKHYVDTTAVLGADGIFISDTAGIVAPTGRVADPTAGAVNTVQVTAARLTRVVRAALKGDGTHTSFDITHNFSNYAVLVQGYTDSGGNPSAPIQLAWTSPTANKITVTFPVAPTSGTVYYAVITG